VRHPEVALEILLRVAASLLTHDHDRLAIQARPPPDDRRILTEQPIAVELHEVREAHPDVIECEGTLRIASHLDPLKRRQVLVDLGPKVIELPLEGRDLRVHTELLIPRQLLQLIDLLLEVEDGSLELHDRRRGQVSSPRTRTDALGAEQRP
jgi:hypothetical protein